MQLPMVLPLYQSPDNRGKAQINTISPRNIVISIFRGGELNGLSYYQEDRIIYSVDVLAM